MQNLVGLLTCATLLVGPGFAAAHTPYRDGGITLEAGHKQRQQDRAERRHSRGPRHGHRQGHRHGRARGRQSHSRDHYYYYAPPAYHYRGQRRPYRQSHYW